jgi:hypothetical protein
MALITLGLENLVPGVALVLCHYIYSFCCNDGITYRIVCQKKKSE